ncbi:MAG TPA: O-methyltransferase [Candidatus Acidoferrales bacterium]|nr:O-methyltransferase [Candidatus Acidoferrales bacterium]
MHIVHPAVDKYLYAQLPKSDPILAEMERYAKKHDVPIVGPAVGRLLFQLVQLIGAKRIFELGSAIGYSTLWMARAAGSDAEIYYTDGDPANAERARGYFERAGVTNRIRIGTGDALELLRRTPGKFDLIFNDVDKEGYPDVFQQAVPRVRSGGLFITDNTLWSGRVVKKATQATTRAIQKFNKLAYASEELFPVLVPLRDGVLVCRKK